MQGYSFLRQEHSRNRLCVGVLSKTGQVMRVSAVLASVEHYLESILLSRSAGPLWQIDVSAVLGALQIVHYYHSMQLRPVDLKSKEAARPESSPKQSEVAASDAQTAVVKTEATASDAQPAVAQAETSGPLAKQSQAVAPVPAKGFLSAADLVHGAIRAAVQ